jgi:hypothetical protein
VNSKPEDCDSETQSTKTRLTLEEIRKLKGKSNLANLYAEQIKEKSLDTEEVWLSVGADWRRMFPQHPA